MKIVGERDFTLGATPAYVFYRDIYIKQLSAKIHLHYAMLIGKAQNISLALGVLANARLADFSEIKVTSEQHTRWRTTPSGGSAPSGIDPPLTTYYDEKSKSTAKSFQYGLSFLVEWHPQSLWNNKLNFGFRLDHYLSEFNVRNAYSLDWKSAVLITYKIN